MFPKRKINNSAAHASYAEGSDFLATLLNQPKQSDMKTLAFALDRHFHALGAMLGQIAESVDMLFERIDNLERRIR